jgi:hypothetical protein
MPAPLERLPFEKVRPRVREREREREREVERERERAAAGWTKPGETDPPRSPLLTPLSYSHSVTHLRDELTRLSLSHPHWGVAEDGVRVRGRGVEGPAIEEMATTGTHASLLLSLSTTLSLSAALSVVSASLSLSPLDPLLRTTQAYLRLLRQGERERERETGTVDEREAERDREREREREEEADLTWPHLLSLFPTWSPLGHCFALDALPGVREREVGPLLLRKRGAAAPGSLASIVGERKKVERERKREWERVGGGGAFDKCSVVLHPRERERERERERDGGGVGGTGVGSVEREREREGEGVSSDCWLCC